MWFSNPLKSYKTKEKIMLYSDIDAISLAAVNKADICNNHPVKYFIRSIMAGFYIVVATILSNVTGAVFFTTYPQIGRFLSSLLFSIAIVLVVFLGGELFTGNNMVMAMGVYTGKCKVSDMIKTWGMSYVGNFAGAFILSSMLVLSGASRTILTDYYDSFIYTKLSASSMELLLRGILCNFLVCLAVYTGMKLKSESGKMIIMFCVITAFVIAGFEHCVANMGTFTIGYMLLGDIGTFSVIKSQILVTIGNIVGGALLLSLPLKLMSDKH